MGISKPKVSFFIQKHMAEPILCPIKCIQQIQKVQHHAVEERTGLLVFANDWQVRDKPKANGLLRHPEVILTPTAGYSQNRQCRWFCEFWFKEGRYKEIDKVHQKPGGEVQEQGRHKVCFFFSVLCIVMNHNGLPDVQPTPDHETAWTHSLGK